MAACDLSQSLALRALKRQQLVYGWVWLVSRWLTRIVALVALFVSVYGLYLPQSLPLAVLIVAYFGLGLAIIPLILDLYAQTRWSALPELSSFPKALSSQPPPNLADYLTLEAAELVARAEAVSKQAGVAAITAAHFLQAVFLDTNTRSILARGGLIVPREALASLAVTQPEATDNRPTLADLLSRAGEEVVKTSRPQIDEGDCLLALFSNDSVAEKLAFSALMEREHLEAAIAWQRRLRTARHELPAYEQPVGAGIAEDWTTGYTPFLIHFSTNLTRQVAATPHQTVYGRDQETTTVERWLAKQQGHNVLLVGEPGIGKTAIVRGLARRMIAGMAPTNLRYHQILALDVPSLLAGVSDRGGIEARILRVFADAAQAGNIILYLEDIHLLVGGGDRVAGVDATEVLLSALRAANLYVIATTSPAEYQERIGSNSAVAGLFERLDVHELDSSSTLEILEDMVPRIEHESQVFLTVQALLEIVRLAERYLRDQPFPQKALNLLTELGGFAQETGNQLVGAETVQKLLSDKLKVPLETATGGERDKLLHLAEELHKTVIAQDEAISAIVAALQRARAGLASGKRPIASFLFLGPTGVGKTESAKALARVYFGDEKRMIRLDMSEYQQSDGLVRILGAPGTATGVKVGGQFVDQVHDQPFSLILLDELEKAHPQILNLFLQVLDDGRLTDGTSRVIDFTNTIIIATSNAGAELIRTSITAGEDQATRLKKLINYLQEEGIYRPEFLNRFDGVIDFHPLNADQMMAIVRLMLGQLTTKLANEQHITVAFGDDLVEGLARTGFDPQFGARPARRLIQDTVEHYLAQKILEGKLGRGQSLTLTAAEVGLQSVA